MIVGAELGYTGEGAPREENDAGEEDAVTYKSVRRRGARSSGKYTCKNCKLSSRVFRLKYIQGHCTRCELMMEISLDANAVGSLEESLKHVGDCPKQVVEPKDFRLQRMTISYDC
jgi:hypothetical protein